MKAIVKNSQDMESFLRRRQSWKGTVRNSLKDFAEAIGTRSRSLPQGEVSPEPTPKRDSDDWTQMPGPQQISPLLQDALNRGSAILEHAAKKSSVGGVVNTAYYLNHTTTTANIPSPKAPSRSQRRRQLGALARRLRPGTAENPFGSEHLPPALPETIRAASCPPEVLIEGARGSMVRKVVGARMPQCSDQSPLYKYGGIRDGDEPPLPASPERLRGMAPAARDNFVNRRKLQPLRRQYAPREPEKVTVVTGTVDYGSLLDEQRTQRSTLEHNDAQYEELMDTFDKINIAIHRRFSRMLKQSDLLQLSG